MKQSDIALVIFAAAVTAIISYFSFNAILGDPDERVETVPVATLIDNKVRTPDSLVFNSNAIDPTVTVCIGTENPEEGPVDECGNKDKNQPVEDAVEEGINSAEGAM